MDRRKLICAALEYVEANFTDRLVLDELAGSTGYSAPQFMRLFTEYCGITPMRYVNIVRVLAAAELVSEGREGITEIAFDCGFESLEVFERSFKRYFHVSPVDYRKFGCRLVRTPFFLSDKIYYERMRNTMPIDGGNRFDWGRIAEKYAKARNIYPADLFETLRASGVGGKNQKVLDIGTGTGILPFNMARFGGEYTGVDVSEGMIKHARIMCADIPGIKFLTADAHHLPFESGSFDIVTALQCWVYFDKNKLIPELSRVLKSGGDLYIMFMTWLPDEDEIIRKSFSLVHKYNPSWSGYMKRTERFEPDWAKGKFSVEKVTKKDYRLPFSRESWCDRMIASRGIGATLSDEKTAEFRKELADMLESNTAESFTVLHEAVIIKLRKES